MMPSGTWTITLESFGPASTRQTLIDGSEDNAGCWFDGETYVRANELGLDANAMLANNDGYGFFQATQNLIITGPTRTNVNDLRVILIV